MINMDLLIGGLAIGAVYSLLAVGVVLIYRASGVVNFAQGEVMMVGAYAYVLISNSFESPLLQIAGALIAGAVASLLCFVLVHILMPTSSRISQVIGTLALLILYQSGARHLFTDEPLRAEVWIFGTRNIEVFGTTIPMNSAMILGATVVATATVFYWQNWTLYGRSVRAVAEDAWRAALSGIHVRSTLAVSWAVGGMLAGLGGVLIGPLIGVFPAMGADIIFPTFIAAVLGGFSSILGALIGGLALGLIQTYAVVLFGGAVRDVVMFSVLLLVLLWRPTGIFAVEAARKI